MLLDEVLTDGDEAFAHRDEAIVAIIKVGVRFHSQILEASFMQTQSRAGFDLLKRKTIGGSPGRSLQS